MVNLVFKPLIGKKKLIGKRAKIKIENKYTKDL